LTTVGFPVLFSAALFSTIPDVRAQPLGEPETETWVDGPLIVKPGNDPRHADAAVDYSGRKIFVWDSNGGTAGQDIFLRVFDREITSLVGPVQVNTYSASTQDFPQVAVAADNSFLVIWQSGEPPEANPGVVRDVVRTQLYTATGQKSGSEQLQSTLEPLGTTGISANVAALTGSGFVACWQSANTATPGFNNVTIQARLINANGTPNGSQFQVNSLFTGSVVDCDVAALPGGGFVVVWTNPEIHARRYAANGSPIGSEIQVNTIAVNAPRDESAVTVSDDGRILVVWTDSEGADTDPMLGDRNEIRGRIFSSTLAPQGSDFRINALVTGDQFWPKLAPYGNNFFVVWETNNISGMDIEANSVEGRVVTGVNQFDGSQFLVNQYTAKSQGFPGIGGANNSVAIAWRSQENSETSQNVIQGLGWNICGIFCNGFE